MSRRHRRAAAPPAPVAPRAVLISGSLRGEDIWLNLPGIAEPRPLSPAAQFMCQLTAERSARRG